MLYWEFGTAFASEEIICFSPFFLSLPTFVHMEDLAHWLKNYILSIFAYNNNNNYGGGGGGRVVMTSFLVFV